MMSTGQLQLQVLNGSFVGPALDARAFSCLASFMSFGRLLIYFLGDASIFV